MTAMASHAAPTATAWSGVATTSPAAAALPLTRAQRALWFAQQRQPDSPAYTIGQYLEVDGRVDPDLYRRAAERFVHDAEALRIRVVEDPDEGPVQIVEPHRDWEFEVVDVSDDPDPAAAAQRWMHADMDRPRDPVAEPLLTVAVIHAGERSYCYHRVHHLALDGFGAALGMFLVAAVYGALASGEPEPESSFGPLRDVVDDDLGYPGSSIEAKDREFWTGRLADRPVPSAPAGRLPDAPPHRLRRASTELGADVVGPLRDVARTAGVSLSSLLVAAVAAYLARRTGDDEVVLGLPVTARRGKAVKRVPAMVSNIVPLRLPVRPATTMRELATEVSAELRRAIAHQRHRPEDIRADLGLDRNTPVAGPTVNILPPQGDLALAGMPARLHNLSVGPVEDMSIVVSDPSDGTLPIDLDGHPDLYDDATLGAHLRRLEHLLTELGHGVDRAVGALPIATTEDRGTITEFAGGSTGASLHVTIADLFADQVTRSPDATALVSGRFRLSFDELDRLTNRAARELADHDVGPGRTVAVVLPRSGDLMISMLAIVKSGGAYLPIDPTYPDERIAQMIADAGPNCVVTDRATAARLPRDAPLLVVDDRDQIDRLTTRDDRPIPRRARPEDPAYVIYTSGSTGRPKGVVVEHRSLANLYAHHCAEVFAPAVALVGGRRLRVAHISAVSFDAAWDPVLWMLDGHEMHVIDDDVRRDPEALVARLREFGADSIETTPTYADQLLTAGLLDAGVKVVCLGGEAVGDGLWRRLADRPDILAFNFFGPAESTVDTVVARIGRPDHPVIGRPVGNTRAYVLDQGLAPTGVGTVGELYLAGEGLARGYLRQPERTAERFVPDPFGPTGSRMYRTGDLAAWCPGGVLEFAGRTDDQVKIRGFRVELGEIDAVLRSHDDVEAAATVVRAADGEQARLVTYVVSRSGSVDPDALHAHAATVLPEHMVPALYVPVAAMPLTSHGKLDHTALPAPETDGLVAGRSGGRAPATPTEELLAGLFAQALGLPEVGVDDDFFALGGHSLLATRLAGRIRTALDADVPIRTLFEAPTVAALALRIEHSAGGRPRLGRRERPDRMPASAAQRRLWMVNRIDPASAAYNMPVVLRLTGELDTGALRSALHDLVTRHEPLRTVLPEVDGEPEQRVLAAAVAHESLPLTPTPVDESTLDTRVREIVATGFDVRTELPVRARLFRLDRTSHVLVLVVHHVAADGWSLQPLARDLSEAYTARRDGAGDRAVPALAALPVQYADYTLWQREWLGDAADPDSTAAHQLAYWREQLAGLPGELSLPADRRRPPRPEPAAPSTTTTSVDVALDAGVRDRLATLAREHGASTFMALQAALATTLNRVGAGDDVPVGSPIAGRTDEALDPLVGFFVNTLVLRTDLAGDPTFAELLDRVRRTDLDAYSHQDVPFEQVVDELAPPRSLARHPLFQVMLSYRDAVDTGLELPGVGVTVEPAASAVGAKFDLNLDLADGPEGVAGSLSFDPALFDEGTAADLAARFVRVVEAVCDRPDRPVGEIDVLDAAEHDLLTAISDGGPPSEPHTVLDRFIAQVAAAPSMTAVTDGDGRALTFAGLAGRAHHLAHQLIACGAGGRPVAVALPRTVDAVVALLGVLEAGAVYAPVDTAQPPVRIAAILEQARPACAVVDPREPVSLPNGVAAVHVADATAAAAPVVDVAPQDAAYVLFTSGSTGTPKGVVVEHGALANLVEHHERTWFAPAEAALGRRLRVAHTASTSFDASWDPIAWMVCGHELHVVDDDTRRDASALVGLVADAGLDALETTPSHVAALLEEGLLDGDRVPAVLALGGEAVGPALWERLRDNGRTAVRNLYGPTEACVDAVAADVDDHDRPVLGRPLSGVRAHVLDDRLVPLPPGSWGELYLAGAGLARGYLDDPRRTAERFLPDPSGGVRYRTGDRARWTRDGVLEYGGRVDDQVKVRGHRVELGEVEAALTLHPDVARATSVVRGDGSRLEAYLVPVAGAELDVTAVRAQVAQRLPEHMVPGGIGVVDDLPRTPNGKLDTTALPPIARGTSTAPRTDLERQVAHAFAEVLDLPDVGVEDGFFDLGGHSLIATRLLARLRERTGVDLPVRTVFEAPTVAALAARLDTAGSASDDTAGTGTGHDSLGELLPLRTTGDRPPLFAVHPAFGLAWSYASLLGHLPSDQPVYGLQARGLRDGDALPATVEEMVGGYAAAVRSVAPRGPYRLLGFSLGGGLAHRLADRLQADGDTVEVLVVLDSHRPDAEPDLTAVSGTGSTAFETYLLDQGVHVPESERPLDAAAVLRILDRIGHPLAGAGEDMLRRVLAVFRHDAALVSGVHADVVDTDIEFVTALRAQATEAAGDVPDHREWAALVSGTVRNHSVDIEHGRLLSPDAIDVVGPIVAAALERHTPGGQR